MAERHSTGAAKRRREGRVRRHWHHEQLTLRMVLATVDHHSHGALRGQASATRSAPLPTGTGAQYFSMSDDESVPVTGERPAALLEPRPQGGQIADVCPFVQIFFLCSLAADGRTAGEFLQVP